MAEGLPSTCPLYNGMSFSSRTHNYIHVNTGFLPKPAAICKQFSQTHNMSIFGDVPLKLELIHLHFTGRISIALMVRVNGLRRRDGLASATCSELRQGRQRLKREILLPKANDPRPFLPIYPACLPRSYGKYSCSACAHTLERTGPSRTYARTALVRIV